MSDKERTPPRDEHTEQALIGTMMLDSAIAYEAAALLSDDDFFTIAHKRIFHAIKELCDQGIAIDAVTVKAHLENTTMLELAGGAVYLLDLINTPATTLHWRDYLAIVQHKAVLRRIITHGTEIVANAYDTDVTETNSFADWATNHLASAANTTQTQRSLSHASDMMTKTEHYAQQRSTPGGTTAFLSGMRFFDNIIGGLEPGTVTVIAARPSVGKSALAENLAVGFAHNGTPVHIAELEQSETLLGVRLACQRALISSHRVREGTMTTEQTRAFEAACSYIASLPITIDDSGTQTVTKMASNITRTHSRILIVDYLQLMSSKHTDPRLNVSENSRALKLLAKDNDIAVIALSQLSRAVEFDNRRPQLSDLKESGSIEQDADNVFFIHRDRATPLGTTVSTESYTLITAKHRGGVANIDSPIAYVAEWTRFFSPYTKREQS